MLASFRLLLSQPEARPGMSHCGDADCPGQGLTAHLEAQQLCVPSRGDPGPGWREAEDPGPGPCDQGSTAGASLCAPRELGGFVLLPESFLGTFRACSLSQRKVGTLIFVTTLCFQETHPGSAGLGRDGEAVCPSPSLSAGPISCPGLSAQGVAGASQAAPARPTRWPGIGAHHLQHCTCFKNSCLLARFSKVQE